eukprot:790047-Pelagomonas_calceolata.AAC.1
MLDENISPAADQPGSRAVGQPLVTLALHPQVVQHVLRDFMNQANVLAATSQMAHNFTGGIARVQKAGAELDISKRKHAMLWLFQVFVLTA